MQSRPSQTRDLLAQILAKDPSFGSQGYLALVAKIHAPNTPGPGGKQA